MVRVITIRLIKSFEYRIFKNLLIHDVDLGMNVGELRARIEQEMMSATGIKPFLTGKYDTLKLYTKAFGSKTSNLIVNVDHEDWIMDDDSATLADLGIENESEISYFNRALYDAYIAHPDTKW